MFDMGGECYMASCDTRKIHLALRSPFGCPVWLQHVCYSQHFPGVWTNRHQRLIAQQHVKMDMPRRNTFMIYICMFIYIKMHTEAQQKIVTRNIFDDVVLTTNSSMCISFWTWTWCIKPLIYLLASLSVCPPSPSASVNMRYDAWTLHPDDANEGDEQVPWVRNCSWTLGSRSSEQIDEATWS